MCRIAGLVYNDNNQLKADIELMANSMRRGGPDDFGYYFDEEQHIALGHRRLSIIDLSSAGHQPMMDEDEHTVICYNGEVYNFKDIKTELQAAGCKFRTHSDTEVIIQGYRHWGKEVFGRLKGMFACAILDKANNELVLARDPMGIKPLYYTEADNALVFASEIRAFKTLKRFEENPDWKIYFYTYGFLPEPVTTLKGVHPLERGTYLVYDLKSKKTTKHKYHQMRYDAVVTDHKEATELIREKLNLAVERHLISDAPIGFFLSGGIDSSLLTLLGKQYKDSGLHTLSIAFNDPRYSEKKYQDLIAEKVGSEHHVFTLEKEEFLEGLPDIFEAMDQPSTDGVNSYFICKYAKEAGLKAVISGLGADELLGGYSSFKNISTAKKLSTIPGFLLNASKHAPQYKYKKISFLNRKDAIGQYLFSRGYYSVDETAKILGASEAEVAEKLNVIDVPDYVNGLEDGNQMSFLECQIYMQSQLLKDTDYMGMWHSIEVRVPFLDTDFVDAVNMISNNLKFENNIGKQLLIESFEDVLPREIWDRKKQGFVFPFQEWMKSDKGDLLENNKNERLEKLYLSGKLNWTRYWAYMIANMYN